jgi:hypothetical protein
MYSAQDLLLGNNKISLALLLFPQENVSLVPKKKFRNGASCMGSKKIYFSISLQFHLEVVIFSQRLAKH